MIRIRQAVVVEGRYDKNTLSQLIDAPIFTTDGFGIFHDPEKLELLRSAARQRGLVILTDPDGAGFVIRNKLKGMLPVDGVLHAYVPDIPGKERRKAAPGREGKLGVEGMDPQTLITALKNAGAEFLDDAEPLPRAPITKQFLFELGLSGRPCSGAARARLKRALRLPENLSPNGLLEAIQILFDGPEALRAFWEEQKQTKEEG
jgi:ribonuclease M5